MESRRQDSRPRPRTLKENEIKVMDSPSEDRPSRGQGQECSRLRPKTKDTNASVLQKKKVFKIFFRRFPNEKVFKNFVQAISKKNGLEKNFSADLQNFNHQKIVLSSSLGQGNFRGLEPSRPRPRTSLLRPTTPKCVLEAKDVLEDSTSV